MPSTGRSASSVLISACCHVNLEPAPHGAPRLSLDVSSLKFSLVDSNISSRGQLVSSIQTEAQRVLDHEMTGNGGTTQHGQNWPCFPINATGQHSCRGGHRPAAPRT